MVIENVEPHRDDSQPSGDAYCGSRWRQFLDHPHLPLFGPAGVGRLITYEQGSGRLITYEQGSTSHVLPRCRELPSILARGVVFRGPPDQAGSLVRSMLVAVIKPTTAQ